MAEGQFGKKMNKLKKDIQSSIIAKKSLIKIEKKNTQSHNSYLFKVKKRR